MHRGKRNEISAYFGLFQSPEKMASAIGAALKGREQEYALSLHAGNNQVHAFALYNGYHLYARRPEFEQRLVRALGLKPVAAEAGNVLFLRPYYRDSVFYGSRVVEGLSVVSDLQLYLDLKRFPIRGAEASDFIYRRRLAPRWEKALDQGD